MRRLEPISTERLEELLKEVGLRVQAAQMALVELTTEQHELPPDSRTYIGESAWELATAVDSALVAIGKKHLLSK